MRNILIYMEVCCLDLISKEIRMSGIYMERHGFICSE